MWWLYLIIGVLIFAAGFAAGAFTFMIIAADHWLSGYITIDPLNMEPGKDMYITFVKERVDLRKQKYIMLTVRRKKTKNAVASSEKREESIRSSNRSVQ